MNNVVGPLWDGNEVWLLTAGGVTFAAFPGMYAVMFSSFYSPLMMILFALIIRGVAFEFRGKTDNPTWRKFWDLAVFIGSGVPALLFGVAFANIFRGIPIDANGVFQGDLFTFLNPYGLLGGVLFLSFFLVHGALMLAVKSTGELREDAIKAAARIWPVLLGAAVLCLIFSAFGHQSLCQLPGSPGFVFDYYISRGRSGRHQVLYDETEVFPGLGFQQRDHFGYYFLWNSRIIPEHAAVQS